MHLIDHVSAFGSFANNGVHMPYYAIEKVTFSNTGEKYTHPQSKGKRVYSPQVAFMVTDVLSDYQQRTPQFGYCNPLNLSRDGNYCPGGDMIPVAVKTGTTNDFKDVLTVGYTSSYILGVWVGNSNNSPMQNITGIMGAAPIWHDAMLTAMEGQQARGFVNPGGLQKVTQVYADGVRTSDWVLAKDAGKYRTCANTNIAAMSMFNSDGNSVTNTLDNSFSSYANIDKNKGKTASAYCPSYGFAFSPSSDQPPAHSTSKYPNWW
jgi:membrane peptidoglycan carboxypeptidase